MTTIPVPSCFSCKACVTPASGRQVESTCAKVVEPISGTPMSLKFARLETLQGWVLPCGYTGKLWEAKA